MINKIIFYNNHNNGDIHFAREFVKDIMKKTSYDEYYFFHKRNPKLLNDISNLKYGELNENCLNDSHFHVINNDTYINTHLVGIHDISHKRLKDVNLDVFYDYFQIIFHKLRIPLERKSYYVPDINYEAYEIDGIKEYIRDNRSFNKVLICNGDVYSLQSGNLDFKILIEKIATEFPQIHFILTDDKDMLELDNVISASSIIKTPSNLNEISYLSTFCSIIIGRASGPYSFAEVKTNLNDEDKTFIFICNTFSDGIWYEQNLCTKVWINDYNFDNIYNIIEKEVKKLNNYKNMLDISSQDNKIIVNPLLNIPHNIRIEFYQDKEILYKHVAKFDFGIFHWIVPHGQYQTGTEIKCRFYNDDTNDYLFQKIV